MKNLTRIFLAVAVLFSSFACTTDVTEDLGVGVEGQTKIVLSLEESRTQLGEKAGEVYPLYWSNGDKISVNGVESAGVEVGANSAVATFTLPGTLTTPYCIAYPAAAEGQVLFAAEQSYAEGTFASGVSTMYAYSENGGGIQLNHLTGVLKIGVTGGAKLVLAQVSTVDRKPIAGAFDIDFTNGELTATATSTELIAYSFGEGVALSAEPTYLHVAVPAGVYNELYITLYDEQGGVMYATVKANDEKPLAAGMVREFSNAIVYTPNTSVFVIKDVASLKDFAAQAATLEKDVLFVADVDLSGEAWTPIEGYAGTINGNGYAIKGLTAPLFGTTSASFKGLHLKDVNIESFDKINVGGLAECITATDTILPTVKNCSSSGKVTVKNESLLGVAGAMQFRYAGLVAYAKGVEFDSCHNYTSVTVLKGFGNGQTESCNLVAGGVVGMAQEFTKSDATVVYSNIYNCSNNADISCANPTTATKYPTTYVGGVAGASATNNTGVHITNCVNKGKVSAALDTANTYIGGIFGYADSKVTKAEIRDCINYGVVEWGVGGYAHDNFNMGGIAGRSNSVAMFNCHNYGALNMVDGSLSIGTISVGGIVGCNVFSDTSNKISYRIENCTNNAPINAGLSHPEGMSVGFRFAGIGGYIQAASYYNINNVEGKITVSGNLNTNGSRATADNDYKSASYVIAGLVGYKTEGKVYGGENHADIVVSANVKELSTKTISQIRVAGLVSYLSTDINDSGLAVSDGDITISGTFDCEIMVGGNIALTYSSQTTDRCSSNIIISGQLNGGLHAGGVIGLCYKGTSVVEYDGSITVTEGATIGTCCYIGGCVGRMQSHESSAYTAKIYRNRGNILFAGTSTATDTCIGGCIGSSVVDEGAKTHTYSDMQNLGNITVSGTTKKLFLSGICYRTTGHGDNLFNGKEGDPTKGILTFSGKTTNATRLYISGLVYDPDNNLTSCANYGAINMSGSTSSTMHIGGISASNINPGKTWTDVCNYGNMTISGFVGDSAIEGSESGADTFVGGMFDIITESTSVSTMIRCGNYGNIEFTDTFKSANAFRCSGFYPRQENARPMVLEDCFNAGNFTMNGMGSARSSGNFKVAGGIADMAKASITIKGSFKNTGDITVGGGNKTATVYIGGIGHLGASGSLLADGEGEVKVINTGKITYTGYANSDLRVGGITPVLNKGGIISENIKFINTGDIEVSGSYPASKTAYVGGIVGNSTMGVNNAEVFCNINALPTDGTTLYTGVGFITGGIRSADLIASNCKVGGQIIGEYNIEDEEYKIYTLDESNYFNFIYGSGESTDWTGTDNYDGCSVLTEKPSVE